jgi:hypothetical protein
VGLAAVRLLGLKGSLYRISPAVRTSQIASGDATERRARTAWSRQYIRSTHPHLPRRAPGASRGRAPDQIPLHPSSPPGHGGGHGSEATSTAATPATPATPTPPRPPVVECPRHC